VRKGSVQETIWHTTTIDGLLTHASDHLTQVDIGTFRATDSHDKCSVVLRQASLEQVTGLLTDVAKLAIQAIFETLVRIAARFKLQFTVVEFLNHRVAFGVTRLQQFLLGARKRGKRRHITDTD